MNTKSKSKKLTKSIILGFICGGMLSMSSSAWAQNYTITIGSGGAATSDPSGITSVILGGSGSYIGITGGSMSDGDAITSITTAEGISSIVYGIYTTSGTNTISFASGSSITAKSTSARVYGISLEGGTNTIGVTGYGLGSITAETGGSSIAYGIYAKNVNAAGENPTFSVTMSNGSITAYSAKGSNYGILFETGGNGKSSVIDVNKIMAGVATTGGSIGSGYAYGIQAEAGVNTVTFTGGTRSIMAKSKSAGAYGIRIKGGTSTIGQADKELGSIVANTTAGSGNAEGIYVDGASTTTVAFAGTDSAIMVNSAGGQVYGINAGSSVSLDVTGIDRIFVTSGSTSYGVYAEKGTNTVSFLGGTKSIEATSSGATTGAYGVRTTGGINNVGTTDNALKSITVNTTGGTAGGIYTTSGTTTVTFTGSDSSISATSSSGGAAYGIYVAGGTTTITGDATNKTTVFVSGAENKGSAAVYVAGGILTLKNFDLSSGTRINADTVAAKDAVGVSLNLQDSVLAGTIKSAATTVANALTINFSGNSEWTLVVDDISGKVNINNTGNLKYTGDLIKDIGGAGTTILQNVTVKSNTAVTIAGTLNGNDKTVDMQEAGTTAAYSTLTVGKLVGTTNLKIDVDLKDAKSDKINISGTENNDGILNLTSINVRKDIEINPIVLAETYTDKLTYVDGKTDGITFKIGGKTKAESGSIIVGTATSDNYIYNFTLGSAGKLNYKVSATDVTFKKFIEGGLGDSVTTLSLNNDMTDGSGIMSKNLYINLNGKTLGTAIGKTVTVGTETMDIDGGITQGTVYTGWTVAEGGSLNTSGLLKMEGSVSGDGTLTNTGTLDITADNLSVATINDDTINLGAGTLAKAITGGTLNINGDVTADASNIAADTNKVTGTLNVTSDGSHYWLAKPISGTGVVNIEGSTPITVLAAISVATLNINNGTLNVQPTGAISSKVINNAYLQANAGQISGEVTNKKDATMDAVPNVITGGVKNGGSLILNLNGGGTEAEPIALGCEINNDGENVGSTTVFHYVSSNKNITNNVYVGGVVISRFGPLPVEGHLSITGTINGTINITENSSLDLNSAYSNATAIDNDGTLNVTAAHLGAAVDNAGTVNLGAGELTEVITGGTVNINDNVTTVADFIAGDTNAVAESATLTLTAGTLSKDVTNSGTVKTIGNVIISSKLNGGTTGKLVVESGTLKYTNTTAGSITNDVEIKAGASMDQDAGVFATGTMVTNYGNLKITGGNLAASVTNYSTGNLEITEPVTVAEGGNITFENGSTLKLVAEKYFAVTESAATADKAAIQGIDSATNITVDNGAKLALTGEIENGGYYVILGGTAVSGLDAWQGLKLTELFPDDDAVTAYEVVKANGALSILPIKTTKAEENINCFAGVQQGMISVTNQVADEVMDHLSLAGKGREEGEYKKDVWASYIRNKDDVKGMDTSSNQGSFGSDYRAQVNGVTVGADLFTSKKAIGGIAINYATGDTSGIGASAGSAMAQINNKTKYYGVELYNRITNDHHAILMDIGYMCGNNEISAAEAKSWTADADVNTITAGLRWERDILLKGSKLVPFAGVRYIRLQSKDFTNSKGLAYSTNSQNLIQPKVGLGWTGEYYMSKSDWTFKPSVEVGYLWAFGNREAETNAFINKYFVSNKFDVTDKSSYYAKLGMDFMCRNFMAGIGYSYMKGNAVRNNRWNVNLDWTF